jgi:hypothetical protein
MVVEHFPDHVTHEDIIHHKDKILTFGDRQMTLRQLMIKFGRMYREIDQDFWVKKTLAKINHHEKWGCEYVIIDDMRYASEYELLKRRGACVMRVERPGVELIDDESETALDHHKFDMTLHNDEKLDAYFNNLEGVAYAVKTGTWR